jgi:uncharacterized protein YecE (DUF72 family)
MQFLVGTSGYSYKEWKGIFYPEKLPAKEMLSYYAERFTTVEINNSFYRMPKQDVVKSWAEQTPPGFEFVLKASQSITHYKRLKNAEQATDDQLRVGAALGDRQGPLLVQLHPTMKKDVERLDAFLAHINQRLRVAIEVRHESWLEAEVLDCLRKHACVLCVADAEDLPAPELSPTADWGYVRLRRERYADKQLRDWIKRLRAQPWKKAYVFFKHEDTATGPKLAAKFLKLAQA